MNRRSFLAWSAFAPLSAVPAAIGPKGRYHQAGATPSRCSPTPTGLACLDELLGGGLMPGELTLLAMAPGSEIMGYLAAAILDHHLQHRQEPAALVSAHLNRQVVVRWLAASRAGVDRHRASRGFWRTSQEGEAYELAARSVEASALHYESIQRLRYLADVERSLRSVHQAHPLALVVIDDIAELRDIACGEPREGAAERVGRDLHGMARSMSAPILAGCSLAWATEWGPLSPELTRGFDQPSQRDLGPLVPILDHCDAALFAWELPQLVTHERRLAINVEFHPRVSRGSSTFHTIDRLTGRIADGA